MGCGSGIERLRGKGVWAYFLERLYVPKAICICTEDILVRIDGARPVSLDNENRNF